MAELKFCPVCRADGETSRVYPHGRFITAMAIEEFYDEQGQHHFHDRNNHASSYSCSRGHRWVENIRPGCHVEGCEFGPRTVMVEIDESKLTLSPEQLHRIAEVYGVGDAPSFANVAPSGDSHA